MRRAHCAGDEPNNTEFPFSYYRSASGFLKRKRSSGTFVGALEHGFLPILYDRVASDYAGMADDFQIASP